MRFWSFFGVRGYSSGPVIGGLIVQAGSTQLGLIIDAATFVIAGFIVLLIGIRRPPEALDKTKKLFDGALEGMKVLVNDPIFAYYDAGGAGRLCFDVSGECRLCIFGA